MLLTLCIFMVTHSLTIQRPAHFSETVTEPSGSCSTAALLHQQKAGRDTMEGTMVTITPHSESASSEESNAISSVQGSFPLFRALLSSEAALQMNRPNCLGLSALFPHERVSDARIVVSSEPPPTAAHQTPSPSILFLSILLSRLLLLLLLEKLLL